MADRKLPRVFTLLKVLKNLPDLLWYLMVTQKLMSWHWGNQDSTGVVGLEIQRGPGIVLPRYLRAHLLDTH